jgi:chitinase
MKRGLKRFLSLVIVLAIVFTLFPMGTSVSSAASGKNFVVYFPNWGMYNATHMSMNVGMIPWNKVTCINHAFFTIDSSFKLASTDDYADFQATFAHSEGWDPGMLRGHFGEYKYYKTQYPNVKVVISVGGWTRGENFHAMALTSSSRAIFIQSVIDFLKKYPFIDGIDLDWEYPGVNRAKDPNDEYDRGCPGGPEDKENFTALLREIREAYNNNGMSDKLLTIAAPGGYEKVDLTEPDKYAQYLDWLNIMTYDIHGAWETVTNHQSAIYKNPNDPSGTSPVDIKNKYNTDYIMKYYRDTYNVPASKLNVGSPFYSRGWKNVVANTGTNGLFAKANGAPVGNLDNPSSPGGQNSYAQMKILENTAGYTKYRDSLSQVPWLYNSSLGIMYTYEDETSAAARCDYVIDNGFGGVIGWEISCDTSDFALTNTISGKLGINGAETVTTPVFSPEGGTYSSAQNVTISCATAGAAVRYTTDGSEPTSSSNEYTGAIKVSSSTTIKAKAFKSGMNDSATASAAYTINNGTSQVATPTFSPAGGTYKSAQKVTISCTTAGTTIRYTTDGSEPNSTSTMYNGQINISSDTIIKAKAFKAGMNDSATASAAFTILSGDEGVDIGNPTGAPAAGLISHNNWDGDGVYDITMEIWWGNNATSWTIYENDKIVLSEAFQGNSPNAQTLVYGVSGRANGTYTYRIDLKNKFGTTTTNTITVNVNNGGSIQTVAAPVVSPAGGTYATEQNVTASCATEGATIRYTTDGTEPTENSTIWSGVLTISHSTTIKLKAFKTGMNNSTVAAATYTISSSEYPAWAPNTPYSVGTIVSYNGSNYSCLQSHNSLPGWEPSNVPALWTKR